MKLFKVDLFSTKYSLLLCFVLLTFYGFSQAPEPTLHSPYNTISVHSYYLQPTSFEPNVAAQTLNQVNPQLAIELKQILDGKGLRIQLSSIPTDSMYRDSLTKKEIYILFPKVLPEVYIEKVGNQWFYSKETVREIPRLHREVYPLGSDVLVKLFPKIGQYKFLGLELWQYFGMLFLMFFTFLTYKVFNGVIRYFLRRLNNSRFSEYIKEPEILWRIVRLTSLLVVFWFLMRSLPILQLPIDMVAAVLVGLRIARTILLINLLLRAVDLIIVYARSITAKTANTLDDQLMPIIKRSLYTIITIVGAIHILSLLDVNVTALIAGISIGGLALALAAQDTVKNFIGSIMIFVDRPFQIGDAISIGAVSGVVEEVGFRSTRIRTPSHSITTVPNGMLANMVVDNLGLRVYRKFKTDLTLTYQTSPENIELFVQGVQQLLSIHPKTRKEGQAVYFHDMTASSLNIVLSTHLIVDGWNGELQARQDIFLAIIQLANQLNVQFAYPSTTVFIEKAGAVVPKEVGSVEDFIATYSEKWSPKEEV